MYYAEASSGVRPERAGAWGMRLSEENAGGVVPRRQQGYWPEGR
jgi:hypothetical protein